MDTEALEHRLKNALEKVDNQSDQVKELEDALRKYGDHLGTCYKNLRIGDCNCGFEQALKGGD